MFLGMDYKSLDNRQICTAFENLQAEAKNEIRLLYRDGKSSAILKELQREMEKIRKEAKRRKLAL